MKRRKPLPKGQSRRQFKKATGVHAMNHINPRKQRGGIRL